MRSVRYDTWKETALTLHFTAQMLGKVKLARMPPQPEWGHVLLDVTADGFDTGLIPNDEASFSIALLAREGKVRTTVMDGRRSEFAFEDGLSVSAYYERFNAMLEEVDCATGMLPVPMEMSVAIPFPENTQKLSYDAVQTRNFFAMCVFARNALLRFVAPFRGKKILPSFFWGTFDVTAVLFGGKPRPFNGGGIIEKGAFDEQLMEFGFWPGDDQTPEPSFFVLPYPFLTRDAGGGGFRPDKAVYSKEKAEFFFALRDVLDYPDPQGALQAFFRNAFRRVAEAEHWENLDWLTQPLETGNRRDTV